MQLYSKHILFLTPALILVSACDAPTDAPAEPVEDQSVTDDFTSDQPVVEDPMAGDMVVEDSPELSSGGTGSATGGDTSDASADESAIGDAAKILEEQSETEESEKAE